MSSVIDDDQSWPQTSSLGNSKQLLAKTTFCKRTGSARELAAPIKSWAVQIGNVLKKCKRIDSSIQTSRES